MYLGYMPVFLLLLLLLHHSYLATGIDNQKCTMEDTKTVRCNYIPNNLSKDISRVRVVGYTNEKPEIITHVNFSSPGWNSVEYLEIGEQDKLLSAYLTFQKDCFVGLSNLIELGLHMKWLSLSADAFLGLDSVEILDVSSCPRLKFGQLVQALNGSRKLPGLRKLIMSKLNYILGSFAINDTFTEVLMPRNITYIDISSSQISMLNISSLALNLKNLEVINGSYSVIEQVYNRHLKQSDVKHFRSIDFSQAILPARMSLPPGRVQIANVHMLSSNMHSSIKILLTPETMNFSGMINQHASVTMTNCTATIDTDMQWYTTDLILQQNHLKRLDIKTLCSQYNISSLRFIDLSMNDMEYIHPSFLYCMPNLVKVDLSKNKLYMMISEDMSLFESLFYKLQHIKFISLSANNIVNLPRDLFINSEMVETIDLSNNRLEQVTFTLQNLHHLHTLDLSSNKIYTLNSDSLSHLNSIPSSKGMGNDPIKVIFKFNPISCSSCSTKTFLEWLLSSNLTDMHSQKLTCTTEDHRQEPITESTIHMVQKICTRKIALVAGTVSGGVMLVLIITVITVVIIRKRRARKLQNRTNVINMLRAGDGQHEFVAYLAYSSDDQDFIDKNVFHPLKENLQLMTGIDRELICIGDVHLRFGFNIESETIRCIERSSVVIVVVSRKFCLSKYCRIELDEAYMRRKPIVLMFKEHVDEDFMMPTMKELYRNNVRMLWTFENGQYVLKSSWENACTSILDLVQCDV